MDRFVPLFIYPNSAIVLDNHFLLTQLLKLVCASQLPAPAYGFNAIVLNSLGGIFFNPRDIW